MRDAGGSRSEEEEIYSFQRDVVDKDHHSIFYVVSYKRLLPLAPSQDWSGLRRREKSNIMVNYQARAALIISIFRCGNFFFCFSSPRQLKTVKKARGWLSQMR